MRFVIFLFLFSFSISAFAQLHPNINEAEPTSLVKWIDFKTAFAENKKNPKPFIIDVYTHWCGWCKHMLKTTYSNANIANYINQNFYPIQFNAETLDSIYFNDSLFINRGTGFRPVHDLTLKLMGSQLSYPTTIFMINDLKTNANVPGYLDDKAIEPILIFFAENIYKNCSFDDFNQSFQKAYYDSAALKKIKPINMFTFEKAEIANKTKPKKWLINLNTEWCNTCKVMRKVVYTDTLIAKYINDNFYYIDFDVQLQDSIRFNNYTFKFSNDGSFPIHSLAPALVGNQITLPTMVLLDEDLKRIDMLPRFYTPKMLQEVLHFYGDNAYKKMQWSDFRQTFKSR